MAATAEALDYHRGRLSEQSMAYSADYHANVRPTAEVYAHATARIGHLGRTAFEAAGGVVEVARTGIYKEVRNDFLMGIEENLTTDEEFGDRLKFDGLRPRPIVEGKCVDKDGRPIIDTVKEGLEASKKAAAENSLMSVQVERDKGDVEVAEVVDSLAVGEAYIVTSMDPKEALNLNPEFWKNIGYEEGMAIIHLFYRDSQDQLLFGTYSVKRSSEQAMRTIMEQLGAIIPTDISDNHWTRHGARFMAKDKRDINIHELGKSLQDQHKQLVGHDVSQISITDLVNREEKMLNGYFDGIMVPLCRARYTGKSESVVADFARNLLLSPDNLSPSEIRTLMRVANSSKFSVEDTRVMESFIRYAVVEELRKKLVKEIQPQSKELVLSGNIVFNPASVGIGQVIDPAVLNQNLASNVEKGREAGREYLGCSPVGQAKLDSERNSKNTNENNENSDKDQSSGSTECEYQATVCYCCPYNSDGSKASKPVVVTIRRRASGDAECKRPGCFATLSKSGVASKGAIYNLAMQRQKAEKARKQVQAA